MPKWQNDKLLLDIDYKPNDIYTKYSHYDKRKCDLFGMWVSKV